MKTVDTEEMIVMIEEFMSLRKGDKYIMHETPSKSEFMFVGDAYQVQEEVLK